MKTMLKTGLAVACLLGFAAPTAAQAPGIELKVNPRVGLYVPLSDLGELQSTAGAIAAEKSGSLTVGLGVELDLALLPVGLRANVDYVPGSDISAEGVTDNAGATTMLAVSADAVLRPLPRIIILQPYLFAGGGLRQYSFDVSDPNVDTLEDASDPTVHLGGGLDLKLGPLNLNAEIADYISWYESQQGVDAEMQHDMLVSIGLIFGFL